MRPNRAERRPSTMQKLAKRSAQAHHQATRRAQLMLDRQTNAEKVALRHSLKQVNEEITRNIRQARQARREEWELGPLARKRDLGFTNYGVMHNPMRLTWGSAPGTVPLKPQVLEKRCAWAGGSKQLNLALGDRVIIMDGADKGKVDTIERVDARYGYVMLKNLHRGLVSSPFGDAVRSSPLPLAVDSVRLVYPLPHPETMQMRDVIINQLKAVPPNMKSANMTLDRWEHGNKWDRLVPGLNVVIPWPEVKVPENETERVDTGRAEVQELSFYYSLLSLPMPEQVIDELRNKYSKFRTRHEAWYITKKEAEAAAKQNPARALASMQTPLEEYREQQRALRAATPEPQLSEDMLARIGEVMARHMTKTTPKEKAAATGARQPLVFNRLRRRARAAARVAAGGKAARA